MAVRLGQWRKTKNWLRWEFCGCAVFIKQICQLVISWARLRIMWMSEIVFFYFGTSSPRLSWKSAVEHVVDVLFAFLRRVSKAANKLYILRTSYLQWKSKKTFCWLGYKFNCTKTGWMRSFPFHDLVACWYTGIVYMLYTYILHPGSVNLQATIMCLFRIQGELTLLCCYWQASVKPQSKAAKAKKTKKSCKGRKASVRKGAAMSLIDKVLTTMDKHKEVACSVCHPT